MKTSNNSVSSRANQIIGSLYFAFFLSLIMLTSACNPGTSQDEETQVTETAKESRAEFQNIDVAKFDGLRDNETYVVLDVRTPKEIADGKVENAIELDYFADNFDSELKKLAKDKKYLIYCKAGGRSAKAAQKMIDMGYTDVSNLLGGYTSWSSAHPDNK